MKKVQGRLRGFIALMLAMMIAMGFMPMQSVKAATIELSYFLVCYGTGENDSQFVGKGKLDSQEASSESGGLYELLDPTSSGNYNHWLSYHEHGEGWKIWSGKLEKVNDELEKDEEQAITVDTDTKLYFGNVKDSDLNVKIENLNIGNNREFGILKAGQYKLIYDGYNSSNKTFEFAITPASIKISQKTLEMRVGDPDVTLSAVSQGYDIDWVSDNPSVAKVDEDGDVTAVGVGTATIKVHYEDNENVFDQCTVTVKAAAEKDEVTQNEVIKDKDGNDTGYVVANADKSNFQASYKGTAKDKKAKKVKILDEITDGNGNVFKVTEIEPEALKNAKGKELIIGKNIKKIGKKALKNAKFKKITLKTDKKGKIKIEKDAFKVKSKKCTVKIKGIKKSNKQKLSNKILKQASKGVTIK